ncbi:MAG: hypothetical protein ACI4C1_06165 [Lachnospiraceae bacterium]
MIQKLKHVFRIAFAAVMLILCLSGCSKSDAVKNGIYEIEVTLTGGTGRAYVESPMQVEIQDGVITAKVVWSSPNYDLMCVNENNYYPVNTEGNSTFEIPLANLTDAVSFEAETLAMSEAHMISYTLELNADSLKLIE